MLRDFIAIDFETANQETSSVCSVGVVMVRDGQIVDSFYEHIPHSQWHLFRHSRHTCFVDAHEEYCQVLTHWLAEND